MRYSTDWLFAYYLRSSILQSRVENYSWGQRDRVRVITGSSRKWDTECQWDFFSHCFKLPLTLLNEWLHKWYCQLIQIRGTFLWIKHICDHYIDVICVQSLLLAYWKWRRTSDWLAVWGKTSHWPIDYDQVLTQLILKPMGYIYKTLGWGECSADSQVSLSLTSSLQKDLLSHGE